MYSSARGVVHFIALAGMLPSLVMQVIPPATPESGILGPISQISQLGMVGVLSVAVVVLWRKLQDSYIDRAKRDEQFWTKLESKDSVMMEMHQSIATTLATSNAALAANNLIMAKMADTLDSIKQATDQLSTVRSALSGRKRIDETR